MSRSSWVDFDRLCAYEKLYGHMSILIQWGGGQLQIPYAELMLCSKKRLEEITRLASKCGGWKLVDHTKGENL